MYVCACERMNIFVDLYALLRCPNFCTVCVFAFPRCISMCLYVCMRVCMCVCASWRLEPFASVVAGRVFRSLMCWCQTTAVCLQTPTLNWCTHSHTLKHTRPHTYTKTSWITEFLISYPLFLETMMEFNVVYRIYIPGHCSLFSHICIFILF